jgi:hypothetical protein
MGNFKISRARTLSVYLGNYTTADVFRYEDEQNDFYFDVHVTGNAPAIFVNRIAHFIYGFSVSNLGKKNWADLSFTQVNNIGVVERNIVSYLKNYVKPGFNNLPVEVVFDGRSSNPEHKA